MTAQEAGDAQEATMAEATETTTTTPEAAQNVAAQPEQGPPQEGGESGAEQVSVTELQARLEALERELKETRKEAAKYRVKAKETAQEAEKAKTLEEKVAELEAAFKEAQRKAFLADVKVEILPEVGNDPRRADAALALAEKEGLLGEDGIDLSGLKERFPFLFEQQQTGAPPANPGTSGAKRLRQSDIARMTPEEYAKRRAEILEAMRRGEIDPS